MTRSTLADVPRLLRELADALEDDHRSSLVERCGFCGLHRRSVHKLIGGPPFICDGCVMTSLQLLNTDGALRNPARPPDISCGDQFVRSHDVERHGGLVYAVATVPDLDIRRLKIGYTTRPIGLRMEAFRTANPTASLLGLWSAPSDGESAAHHAVDGRLRGTEVFHVPNVVAALTAIDEELRRLWP